MTIRRVELAKPETRIGKTAARLTITPEQGTAICRILGLHPDRTEKLIITAGVAEVRGFDLTEYTHILIEDPEDAN